MKLTDIQTEEKVRLDPKCWSGKKIGDPKTKMKGGVRVNNCVPAESVGEARVGNRMSDIEIGSPKIVYYKGKAVGEVGIDHEASPGNGQYYMKHYLTGKDMVGYDTKQEALAELKYIVQQMNEAANPAQQAAIAINMKKHHQKPKNEHIEDGDYNGEYDDEAGMAQGNLYTIAQAAQGLLDTIDNRDDLPEWCQEKIAKVEGMLVSVWNYLQSQKAQGIDPKITESICSLTEASKIFDDFEQSVIDRGLSEDIFDTITDEEIIAETAAWRRKEGKSKKGGLNAKGVASYRREHPGSKLQTAVTTKPSKLKPGSKAAKRRKSFCARMSGVKGPMKKPNGKPTRKALALRKWNC